MSCVDFLLQRLCTFFWIFATKVLILSNWKLVSWCFRQHISSSYTQAPDIKNISLYLKPIFCTIIITLSSGLPFLVLSKRQYIDWIRSMIYLIEGTVVSLIHMDDSQVCTLKSSKWRTEKIAPINFASWIAARKSWQMNRSKKNQNGDHDEPNYYYRSGKYLIKKNFFLRQAPVILYHAPLNSSVKPWLNFAKAA